MRVLLSAALMATGGCAALTRTHYQTPVLATDARFAVAATGATSGSGPWWNEFADPALSRLVEDVLARNANLAAAGLTLKQARMTAALARQGLLPSISASGGTTSSKQLAAGGVWSNASTTSLSASWEIDLFGKLDAQIDAAEWKAKASVADLANTRLALIGTTVEAWWELGYANEQIALGQDSLSYVHRLLELVQRQYRAGAVSRLDLRDAEQTVAAQEATQTQLIEARAEALKTLAALLDQQSYDEAEPKAMPTGDLPAIAEGLPASLLARRPDLAAAELRLRATLATSDATKLSYYPALTLTGALGTTGSALLKMFSDPAASLGAALSIAELNPAKARLGIGIARADYDIAAQTFRQTFYNALRDTEIALSARDQYGRQAAYLDSNLAAARDAEALYDRQYRAGAIALRGLLDAQSRRRTAQSDLIANRYHRLVAQTQVHLALGG
jgi:NodT family efflux transporter outer membrane factor (OMF) lipoprotein